ncbi:CBS domain-containing protein [Viscerimonas tarda]
MSLQTENNQENHGKNETTNTIAKWVTGGVIVATLAIAGLSLWLLDTKKEAFNFIGQSLLPLWATWFGTVLAFYFTKENLDAANKSTEKLLNKLTAGEQKLQSRSVLSVMKPVKEIKTLYLDLHGENPLSEIIEMEEFKPFNRFPVFNSEKAKKIDCIVHRLVMLEYLYGLPETDTASKTLNDFLTGSKDIREKLKDSAGFVSETATLLDAKTEMERLENCEDVFVTQTGKNSEEILGWITDNDIYEIGKV